MALAICAALVSPATAQAQDACTILRQNAFVDDVMTEFYLWYQFLPSVDPAGFDGPEALLEAIRYRRLDSSFSFISDRAADTAFFSESQFIGFGFSTQLLGEELRVSEVFDGSPAAGARLSRGDTFLEIGGRTVADWIRSGELGAAFGPREIGYSVSAVVRTPAGRARSIYMTKRFVTIPTVSLTRVYEIDGRRVGYVFFRNFVEPSFEALDAAFAELKAAGATELVLDLRYNGGGLVSVAQHLGSLVGGARTNTRVFTRFVHNDKNTFRNVAIPFDDPRQALDLSRLVVITTRASASASELVINALRPFIPVIVIGDRTFGKPVGQYSFAFCDKVLHPVSFFTVNASGEGDYFDGLAPRCLAPDDLQHSLGDATEASLAEALRYVTTGSCSPATLSRFRRPTRLRGDGFQDLIGAY
jgi:C-terminal processing protease CtpA/Prc